MKSYRRYTIRRIAFGLTQQELAKRARCSLSDVIDYENGVKVSKQIYQRIQYSIYLRTHCCSEVMHLKGRIKEIAMCLEEEEDKAVALNNIDHMIIELDRLRKNYEKALLKVEG